MENKDQVTELDKQVSEGLKRAYRKMVEFKKRKNTPLFVSQDGKVVHIPADQIPPTTSSQEEAAD